MSDNYEHDKPYSLSAKYTENPEPTALTAPYDLHATYAPNYVASYLNSKVNFSIIAQITGTNTQIADNHGQLYAKIDLNCISQGISTFNINFELGINKGLSTQFEIGKQQSKQFNSAWDVAKNKPIKADLIFDQGNPITEKLNMVFEEGDGIRNFLTTQFEQAQPLKSYLATLVWEEAERLKLFTDSSWQQGKNIAKSLLFQYQEALPFDISSLAKFEQAQTISEKTTFDSGQGKTAVTDYAIPYEESRAIYYRKHAIEPWEPAETPDYVSTTTLNFQCLCIDEIDPHNVILNFGADDCIPQIVSPKYWYIMNTLSVKREDNGVTILATKGSASVSLDTWCWSFSLTVPESEIAKLVSVTNDPVVLLININGYTMRMRYEEKTRQRTFASDYFTITGRSPSSLLDSPSSPVRAFTQENERTSVQLMQAELDRVNSTMILECELIDALGWIIPADSFSYSNLTPIAAIQQIAQSAGGFVYSSPDSEKLIIKPKYKKVYWDLMEFDEYDRVVPESIVKKIGTKEKEYPDYNAVWLTNSKNGLTVRAFRSGTAANQLQETINNDLFTEQSTRYKAREILAKAYLVETHDFVMPIESSIGLCLPGETFAFNGEWWGIVDAVSIDFDMSTVNQTVSVERVVQDE
ncbi:hypothetical protein ACX1NX_02820 [Acinetobacter sp. ANC 5383]